MIKCPYCHTSNPVREYIFIGANIAQAEMECQICQEKFLVLNAVSNLVKAAKTLKSIGYDLDKYNLVQEDVEEIRDSVEAAKFEAMIALNEAATRKEYLEEELRKAKEKETKELLRAEDLTHKYDVISGLLEEGIPNQRYQAIRLEV